MQKSIKVRQAIEKDISAIDRTIEEWLVWKTSREESIKRAIENKELLVADQKGKRARYDFCFSGPGQVSKFHKSKDNAD